MSKLPHNVMANRANDWDRVPRNPVSVGTTILSAVGAGGIAGTTIAFGVTVAGIVGQVAIGLVTSWALSALAPKRKTPDFSSGFPESADRGLLVNQKNGIAPHEFVYGEARKGGVITYYETTGPDNKFLHQIIALAGHEVDSIGDIYINDEVVTLNGSGFVTSSPWSSKIRIKKVLGSDTQSVDPDLLAESNQIDANFRGRGIAYLYVRYEYDQEVFANGVPLITAVVRGKKVFDPRTSTTAYSNNAALCVRDYITSSYGLKDDQVDDTSFSAAANICDENVNLAAGGTEKRYTINGLVKSSQTHGDTLQDMMTACAGSLFWGAGKWKLVVGDYIAPVKSLNMDDLRSPISLASRVNLRDQFNGVQGTFNDASLRWITTDYPPIKSATFQDEDGGEETLLDLSLPFTTSAASAQRLAKLTLLRGREQMTVTADFGLNAFDVEVGEIITFTNPRYGWNEKEFEVVGWTFGAGEAGDLRVTLTLRETSETAFDWDAEETEIIQNNTNLPSPFLSVPPSLSVDTELRVANQQVVGVLLMTASSTSPFVDRFEVQYKRSADTEWIMAGQAGGNLFEAVGVSDGLFDIRARSVSVLGVRSAFTTITNFYATLFETPPETVQNFAANVVGNTLHLTWTPVSDLDLSHYKVRYSPATSGASYQNAIDIVEKISRPANSVSLPAKSGTYFIKAVDKLGIPSEAATSIVVFTNTAEIEALNVVETLIENPAFDGSKTMVVRLTDDGGAYLALNTTTLFDDATGNFDDQIGLFDGGGESGVVSPSGIYEFSNVIDLGQKYTSRVQAGLSVSYLSYVNSFDGAAGLFDNREGNFDGDEAQFDTTTVKTQISLTDDDPSGAPTWTDWQDFFVGDYAARAMRFRAILATSDPKTSPALRELSVEVDMPDRVEAQDDITYTGSQVVTFPSAFKVTPAIGIAASLADGDRYVISGKSRSGFTITTYTGGSVSTNATTFDYVAKGYGREIA